MDDLFVFGKNLNMWLTLILYLYAGKPNYYYLLLYYSYYSTILNTVRCQVITVVEHPSSLLVPVNEIAVFSCTAHVQCSPSPCYSVVRGQWIVDNTFIGRSIISRYGANELTLNWRINNSNIMCNTSEVRCHFSYSANTYSKESNTAVLKWIDGELLCMHACMNAFLY